MENGFEQTAPFASSPRKTSKGNRQAAILSTTWRLIATPSQLDGFLARFHQRRPK